MRYNTTIQDIAIAGLFVSLAMVSALITTYIPTIPFVNQKFTIWSGIAILGLLFQRNIYVSLSYIIALTFGLMIVELPIFAGVPDYMLENGLPILLLPMFLILKLKAFKNNKVMFFVGLTVLIVVWSFIKFICISWAGVLFWGVAMGPSMIINGPVSIADIIFIIPITFIVSVKMFLSKNNKKSKKYTTENI